MATECARDSANRSTIRLGHISPSWFADQLDHGVVRLADAFSDEWVHAMRESVLKHLAGRGDADGDLFIAHPDQEIGSPAHQLMSDPALRRFLHDVARLRLPRISSTCKFECNAPVRHGAGPKIRSNAFHYDPTVLTMVVPVFIPQASPGRSGELAAFGNRRPFRRFVGTHLLESGITKNPLYRRHLAKKVTADPGRYLVELRPGDAYVFWGYRQFHGNLVCEPGLLRATLIIGFGEVHSSDGWALRLAWRFSRSRRNVGRLQRGCDIPSDTAAGTAVEII
jgi:hypothetical protein